ncbi:MAG: hypothetical protein CL676_02930 [Bdellovibrionaceae bacterium]|nr:hypothetical protein [Pseudobdellovibrionaceae bacterium]|tara:strand:+ start:2930 stop:3532 length:603 start_codon:yes stop_codon:yes gene_type:complete
MKSLPSGYEIRQLTDQEFLPLWKDHASRIFDDNSQIFRVYQWLSDTEKEKAKSLRESMGAPFCLNLGLFFEDKFVGWSTGHQESSETFYMRNSAVLPDHRRKGLYTALLTETVKIAVEKGFQKIYSRHSSTNNEIIIPKLKYGFVITSMEVTDIFGVLVHLTYFPKELRRKMMVYRVGDMKPDREIDSCLDLKIEWSEKN